MYLIGIICSFIVVLFCIVLFKCKLKFGFMVDETIRNHYEQKKKTAGHKVIPYSSKYYKKYPDYYEPSNN